MGLSGDDKPFRDVELPGYLSPVELWLHDLTFWEIHAMELGLLGLLAGSGIRLGLTPWVAFGTAFLVGTAFGFRRLDPEEIPRFEGDGPLRALLHLITGTAENIASRTLGREPWYFTTVYLFTSVLSWTSYPVLL